MSQQFSQDDLEYMINRCVEEGILSDWERNFLESVSDQLDRTGHLSELQQETVDRIYCNKVP